jgi:hypothetical protein
MLKEAGGLAVEPHLFHGIFEGQRPHLRNYALEPALGEGNLAAMGPASTFVMCIMNI